MPKRKNRAGFVDTNSREYKRKSHRIGEGADRLSRAVAEISGQPTRHENPFVGAILRAVRERRDI